jgi:signal transduction histidine kinase
MTNALPQSPTPRQRGMTRLFWRLQILGWSIYSLSMIPSRLAIHPEWQFVLTIMVVKDGFGFLATLAIRELYRRSWLRKLGPAALAPWLVGFCTILGTFDMVGGYLLYRTMGVAEPTINLYVYLAFGVWARTALYTVWSLLYFAIRLNISTRARQKELKRAETRRRDAELLMLRSQMNPHFLFNAFNSMAVRASGNEPLLKMIEHLSDYLRYSLAHRQGMVVQLDDELQAVEAYVALEKIRFGSSLQVSFEIDPETRQVWVPGIFIQPLVENAIKHGRKSCASLQTPLLVNIACRKQGEALVIEVTNTGHWRTPSPSDDLKPSGAGLDILRQSLNLYYENNHQFEIQEKDGKVVVSIRLQAAPVFTAQPKPIDLDLDLDLTRLGVFPPQLHF